VTEYLGLEATHHSQPNGGEWWDWTKFEGARFVVIQRRPDATTSSALAREMAPDRQAHAVDWAAAMKLLAAIPDAYWMSYEALLAQPLVQAQNLAGWLGVTPTGVMPEITDENAKWL
jgi:hypothetical protein